MHTHPHWRGCAPRAHPHCHPEPSWRGQHPGHQPWGAPDMDDDAFGGFGVRRPLRFLAQRLDLDERQVAELARILDELKTERAQAEVDRRRSLAAFADALAREAFDAAKAAEAGDRRVASATRVRDAVLTALKQMHGILNPDQRTRLAYLLRTGVLTM